MQQHKYAWLFGLIVVVAVIVGVVSIGKWKITTETYTGEVVSVGQKVVYAKERRNEREPNVYVYVQELDETVAVRVHESELYLYLPGDIVLVSHENWYKNPIVKFRTQWTVHKGEHYVVDT